MIPKSLRTWFVIHFAADMVTGVPLLVAPVAFLSALGWTTVDPFAARMVGAALMGIGIESYLGRNAGVKAYRGMLNLKIIWSGAAILGLVVTMVSIDGPWTVWLVVAIFCVFHVVCAASVCGAVPCLRPLAAATRGRTPGWGSSRLFAALSA
jgi:hypothetical protein